MNNRLSKLTKTFPILLVLIFHSCRDIHIAPCFLYEVLSSSYLLFVVKIDTWEQKKGKKDDVNPVIISILIQACAQNR